MAASIVIRSPLFADAGRFLPLLYLAAALMVGALLIVLVGRWRKSSARTNFSPSDDLAQYRLLYEKGEISEEEYRKLRSLLGGELRKNLDLPTRNVPPAAPARDEPPPEGDGPPTSGIRPA